MIIAAISFPARKAWGPAAGMPAWLLDIDLQSCVIQLARWTEFSVERLPACLREEMDCQWGFPPLPKLTVDGLSPGLFGIKCVPK